MTKKNQHIGSTFDSWLDAKGSREEATAAAVIAMQIGEEIKKRRVTKVQMAEKIQISCAQLNCLLDPNDCGVTLETLMRAAKVVGRELRLELV